LIKLDQKCLERNQTIAKLDNKVIPNNT